MQKSWKSFTSKKLAKCQSVKQAFGAKWRWDAESRRKQAGGWPEHKMLEHSSGLLKFLLKPKSYGWWTPQRVVADTVRRRALDLWLVRQRHARRVRKPRLGLFKHFSWADKQKQTLVLVTWQDTLRPRYIYIRSTRRVQSLPLDSVKFMCVTPYKGDWNFRNGKSGKYVWATINYSMSDRWLRNVEGN